jgi:hypothetical protein
VIECDDEVEVEGFVAEKILFVCVCANSHKSSKLFLSFAQGILKGVSQPAIEPTTFSNSQVRPELLAKPPA